MRSYKKKEYLCVILDESVLNFKIFMTIVVDCLLYD